MKNSYLLIVISLLIFSCTDENSIENSISFSDKYTLKKMNQVLFPLDSLSSRGQIQYYEKNDIKYLFLLNKYENAIYKYDYNTRTLIDIKKFDKAGQDNFGKLSGFFVSNLDSTYLYSYDNEKLFMINEKGELKKKYTFFNEDNHHRIPFVDSQHKPFISGDEMYLATFGYRGAYEINNDFPETVIVKLNLVDNSFDFELSFSEKYLSKAWNLLHYDVASTYNNKENIKVYSFFIDEFIIVVDANGKEMKKYAGSNFVKKIKPLSNKKIKSLNARLEFDNLYSNPFYANIYYDPFSEKYLRILLIPLYENHEIKKKTFRDVLKERKYSMIIFDSKFNKVGEHIFNDLSYDINNIFFNEKGIHILKKDNNEDFLTYDIFKIIKKHK